MNNEAVNCGGGASPRPPPVLPAPRKTDAAPETPEIGKNIICLQP